jgi:DNA-binding transcriptional ArsR family regulator
MITTFAALADPNRFRIVELLRAGARPVTDIGSRLRLNQPLVSKHLRVLKEAGLVDAEARAQQRLYGLRPDRLREVHDWVGRYRQLWEARFDALDAVVADLEEIEKKEEGKEKSRAPSTRPRASSSMRGRSRSS